MSGTEPERHVLDGFPSAALDFFRALEARRLRTAIAHGVTDIELKAFFRIAAAGSLTPKQLATDLALTNGAVTGISNRLVAAGHIHRVAHPRDRRSLYLELTESGHVSMRAMHEDFRSVLTPSEAVVASGDLAAAARALRVVSQHIEKQGSETAPTAERS